MEPIIIVGILCIFFGAFYDKLGKGRRRIMVLSSFAIISHLVRRDRLRREELRRKNQWQGGQASLPPV